MVDIPVLVKASIKLTDLVINKPWSKIPAAV